jgi:2-polyprenyl-3-methyl-5-hydroxy-6-metoxy-1,4-benzoquinol methylase
MIGQNIMTGPLKSDSSACNLCGCASASALYSSLGIVRCDECGLARIKNPPSAEQLKQIYTESYFRSRDSGSLGYDDYIADRGKIVRTFQRRLQEVERWTGGKGKLLDVGCAAGFSLEVARERGWDVQGVEISEFACNFARRHLNLNVHCGALAEAHLAPASFDVITMWDYIEHCPDPGGEMALANSLLRPGGFIALTSPNIASWPARIWGAGWMGIKDGEHLYYFSHLTMKRLLEQSGFELVRLEHVGKYIDIGFFIKRAGLYSSLIERMLSRVAQLLGIGDWVLYINPFDIMLVYGKKMERNG